MRNFLKRLKAWLVPRAPQATVYNLRDFSRTRRAKSL